MDKNLYILIELLSTEAHLNINKKLARSIGLHEAIILSELLGECKYWIAKEKLENGYFFSTVENIEKNTTLNEYHQRKAIKNLEDMNILTVEKKGIPCKRFFKINSKQVVNVLNNKFFKNSRTSTEKNKELVPKNLKGNNNNNNNKNNNNPTNQVSTNNIYSEVVGYLNRKMNTNYSSNFPNTVKLIDDRLNEGRTLQDFKTVIDKKYDSWKNTEYEKFIRPETLFSDKFEGYLNEPTVKKTVEQDMVNGASRYIDLEQRRKDRYVSREKKDEVADLMEDFLKDW